MSPSYTAAWYVRLYYRGRPRPAIIVCSDYRAAAQVIKELKAAIAAAASSVTLTTGQTISLEELLSYRVSPVAPAESSPAGEAIHPIAECTLPDGCTAARH